MYAKRPPSRLQIFHLGGRVRVVRIRERTDHGRLGQKLVQQLQILCPSKVNMNAMPVTLPAGRLKLETSPAAIGSLPLRKTMGMV